MSLFKPLYDWTLKQAGTRTARWTLAAVSFAESSFFPIPPDVMLLPMCLGDRKRAYMLAAICSVASVLGGLFGYYIGYALLDTVGTWLIQTYHLEQKLSTFQAGFNEWGVAIILAKGLTPIPFKLVTIASGIAHMPVLPFLGACIVTRSFRFFLVAMLAERFGPTVQPFIEKYLTPIMLAILVVLVAAFWVVLK